MGSPSGLLQFGPVCTGNSCTGICDECTRKAVLHEIANTCPLVVSKPTYSLAVLLYEPIAALQKCCCRSILLFYFEKKNQQNKQKQKTNKQKNHNNKKPTMTALRLCIWFYRALCELAWPSENHQSLTQTHSQKLNRLLHFFINYPLPRLGKHR